MNDIQVKVRNQFNTVQRLYRIAFSAEFEDAWRNASDKQKEEMEGYFQTFNHEGAKRLVNIIRKSNLHAMSVPELKHVAKRLQIKCWYKMDKDELIEVIENVRAHIKATRRSPPSTEGCKTQQEKVQTNSLPT